MNDIQKTIVSHLYNQVHLHRDDWSQWLEKEQQAAAEYCREAVDKLRRDIANGFFAEEINYEKHGFTPIFVKYSATYNGVKVAKFFRDQENRYHHFRLSYSAEHWRSITGSYVMEHSSGKYLLQAMNTEPVISDDPSEGSSKSQQIVLAKEVPQSSTETSLAMIRMFWADPWVYLTAELL